MSLRHLLPAPVRSVLQPIWRNLPPRDKRYLLQNLESDKARQQFLNSTAYQHFSQVEAACWQGKPNPTPSNTQSAQPAAAPIPPPGHAYPLAHPAVRATFDERSGVGGIWNHLRQRHFASACLLGGGYTPHADMLLMLNAAERVEILDLAYQCHQPPDTDRIRHTAADLNQVSSIQPFNLFLAIHAIHHVFNLEQLFTAIAQAMDHDALFIFEEYTGPNFLECPRAYHSTIQAIHDAHVPDARKLVRKLPFKTRWFVQKTSPFESIRSEKILPVADSMFKPVITQPLGGCLLQEILPFVATQLTETSTSPNVVDDLLRLDWELTTRGQLPNYFSFCVYGKR